MTKVQITITVGEEHSKYVKDLAIEEFDGNDSMAIRKIIAEHSRQINYKTREGNYLDKIL